jgi:streptogramin lyase
MPSTNRVAGRPVALGSPQSIAFGAGALWVADHTGYLVKLDPRNLRVVARVPLRFGAHGLTVTPHGVFVADAHAGRLVRADVRTGRIERVAGLDVPPIYPHAGGGFVWASSAGAWGGPPQPRDDRVIRVDPGSLSIRQTFRLGGSVPSVGFGFGSLWAADPVTREVIRISR